MHVLQLAVLLYLLLPCLQGGNLRCFYRPLLEKGRAFELAVTECPPGELCFVADGRYGNHSALEARGCVAASDCSAEHSLRLKGSVFTLSYHCCPQAYCNTCTRPCASAVTMTLATVMATASGW